MINTDLMLVRDNPAGWPALVFRQLDTTQHARDVVRPGHIPPGTRPAFVASVQRATWTPTEITSSSRI